MRKKLARGVYDLAPILEEFQSLGEIAAPQAVVEKPEEEILRSQHKRFGTLKKMADGIVNGFVRALIVSGPPGMGKTHTLENVLHEAHRARKIHLTSVSGFVRPTGIFRLLYENREKHNVVLLDDSDSALIDDTSLGLLKPALDTKSGPRMISWRSEKQFTDDTSGEDIPKQFEFEGSIAFITNLNFERLISLGKSISPHLQALMSRSHYIDLAINSPREQLIRVLDILNTTDMAKDIGLDDAKKKIVQGFLEDNYTRMREVSLRSVVLLANIIAFNDEEDFQDIAESVCVKTNRIQ